MTILVDANSRILVQGITGTTGRLFAETHGGAAARRSSAA